LRVTAYDLKLDDNPAGALRDHASAHGVALAHSHADLAAQADIIISRLPRARPFRSRRLAPAVKTGGCFSTSIRHHRRQAPRGDLIDGPGGRYVEGAVMTSIPPYASKYPCC